MRGSVLRRSFRHLSAPAATHCSFAVQHLRRHPDSESACNDYTRLRWAKFWRHPVQWHIHPESSSYLPAFSAESVLQKIWTFSRSLHGSAALDHRAFRNNSKRTRYKYAHRQRTACCLPDFPAFRRSCSRFLFFLTYRYTPYRFVITLSIKPYSSASCAYI